MHFRRSQPNAMHYDDSGDDQWTHSQPKRIRCKMTTNKDALDALDNLIDLLSENCSPLKKERLIDTISAALTETKWRDIKDAPKDGTQILAFDGVIRLLAWESRKNETDTGKAGWVDGTWDHKYDEKYFTFKPTKWMPLPQTD